MFDKSKKLGIVAGEGKEISFCLSPDQLINYNNKNLPAQEQTELTRHVTQCELCSDAVAGMTSAPDPSKVKQNILDLNKEIHKRLAKKADRKFDVKFYYAAAAILLITLFSVFQIFFQQPPHEKLFAEYFQPYPNTIPLTRSSQSGELIETAMMQYELGNFNTCLSQLTTILSKDAKNSTAHFYAGICLLKTNRPEEAIQHFGLVNKGSNFGEPADWYAALAHLKNKNIKTAKQNLNLIVKRGEIYSDQSNKLLNKINSLP